MVTQDFNMMTLCATMERTEEQWRQMFSEEGLKVVGVYLLKDGVPEGTSNSHFPYTEAAVVHRNHQALSPNMYASHTICIGLSNSLVRLSGIRSF